MLFDTLRSRSGGRSLRIAYGRIFHEANAYSPVPTGRDAFTRMHHVQGEALAAAAAPLGSELAGYMPAAELSGCVAAAKVAGEVETIPLSSALAVPSGPLLRETFDWLLTDLRERLAAAMRVDGVYLALHGSMQVLDLVGAPEAAILRAVREVVGPEVRVAVSYDLHANLSAGTVEPADILVGYRRNPHWDLAQTGFRATSLLVRTLRGDVCPVHAWRKLPMVLGGGTTIDFVKPMSRVFSAMRALEKNPAVLSASLFMVHPYTDAEQLGWAVHVCTDGDKGLAARLADELADRAWKVRHDDLPPMYAVADALSEVVARRARTFGPITLVDVDDIVGAGAPGGNTRIIAELVARPAGLRAYVPVHDPAVVEQLWSAPIGSRVDVVFTGTPGYEQPPVAANVTVAARHDGDFGRTVRCDLVGHDAAGVSIAATEHAPLPIHPKFWSELGLQARKADLIVQKNFFHYRIFYAAISFVHLPVISAGATSLQRVRERDYGMPMWPGSDPGDWRDWDPQLRAMSRANAAAEGAS